MLDLAALRRICEDTISRSNEIANDTKGGSLSSSFIPAQLSALSKASVGFPKLERRPVEILDSDSFAAARTLVRAKLNDTGENEHKIAVMNLASDEEPAGGWRYTLSRTQEEALCYSSTLYATLRPEWYPWPNIGPGAAAGIFSPNVVVFRDTLDHDLVELPPQERCVVAVITVAAPRLPKLTEDKLGLANASDLTDLREKIVLILRIAAHNGMNNLVLGAMGCGAYRCPPALVAKEMKAALDSKEFSGWFDHVIFAVHARSKVGKQNYEAFEQEFKC